MVSVAVSGDLHFSTRFFGAYGRRKAVCVQHLGLRALGWLPRLTASEGRMCPHVRYRSLPQKGHNTWEWHLSLVRKAMATKSASYSNRDTLWRHSLRLAPRRRLTETLVSFSRKALCVASRCGGTNGIPTSGQIHCRCSLIYPKARICALRSWLGAKSCLKDVFKARKACS